MKKITACVTAVLALLSLCSCGGGKSKDDAASTDSLFGEEKGMYYNIIVKEEKTEKFVSGRPYDESKEDIALFLVIGQSNFTTMAGYRWEYGHYLQGKASEPEMPLRPEKEIAYSVNSDQTLGYLSDRYDMNTLSDGAKGTATLGGVTPAFATAFNELTGLKVVFVQAAVEATGICEWVKNTAELNCPSHTFGQGRCYSTAVAAFKRTYNALEDDYNIVYSGYIFNQGESDESTAEGCPTDGDQAYYDMYKSMHDSLMSELDLDFGGISVVRANNAGNTAEASNSYTKARAAQYRLCNDIDNLFMISNYSEKCTRRMMDQGNTIHYSQKVFNEMGIDMAENLCKYLGVTENNGCGGITVDVLDGYTAVKFDRNGEAFEGDALLTPVNTVRGRVQLKFNELGSNTTYEICVTVDGKEMPELTDAFGTIDWNKLKELTGEASLTARVIYGR